MACQCHFRKLKGKHLIGVWKRRKLFTQAGNTCCSWWFPVGTSWTGECVCLLGKSWSVGSKEIRLSKNTIAWCASSHRIFHKYFLFTETTEFNNATPGQQYNSQSQTNPQPNSENQPIKQRTQPRIRFKQIRKHCKSENATPNHKTCVRLLDRATRAAERERLLQRWLRIW